MRRMTREQREQAARVLENIWIRYISTFDDIEYEEVDAIDTAPSGCNRARCGRNGPERG